MKASRESQVLRGCLDLLTVRGIFHWRANQGAIPTGKGGFRRFVGLKGVSDILAVVKVGRILCVEVKRPGGRLRPEQKAFLDRINELGGVGVCVDDVRQLERVLEGLEQ